MLEKKRILEIIEKIEYVFKILISIILASTVFIIFDVFFIILNKGYFNISSIIFPIVISIVIYTLLISILRKSFVTINIMYGIGFILLLICQVKIAVTGEPIYFSDIAFLPQIGNLLKLVDLGNALSQTVTIKKIFNIFICIFFIEIFNYYTRYELKNKKIRIGIFLIDVIILLILSFPTQLTKTVLMNFIYHDDEYLDYDGYGSLYGYYRIYGYTNGLYGVYLNNYFYKPENYDEDLLENDMNNIMLEKKEENYLGTPNIIVIFSESFWDIDQLDEIDFNTPITSNFNNLKNDSNFVNLISPTYGGMSENVAFELLTGYSMNFFPKSYIPIISLYNRKNADEYPSLVKLLKKNGYKTNITFVEDFYNSQKSYQIMGFDNYEELNKNNSDIEYTDEYLCNIIKDELKENEDKIFSVYSTYEAHMPYTKNKFETYDVQIVNSSFSEEENDVMTAYAQSVYDADKMLGELNSYIQEIETPIIVLFLGDHLPFVYDSEYNNILAKLEYFNTEDDLQNTYRIYNTQALMLTNFDYGEFDLPEYSSVDLLLNYIINRMDIEVDANYRLLDKTFEIMPASNRYISIDTDGKLYYTNNMTEEMQKIYNYKNCLQYKYLKN